MKLETELMLILSHEHKPLVPAKLKAPTAELWFKQNVQKEETNRLYLNSSKQTFFFYRDQLQVSMCDFIYSVQARNFVQRRVEALV